MIQNMLDRKEQEIAPVIESSAPALSMKQGSFREYIAIARLDHMTKHAFIIPGMILAYALREPPLDGIFATIIIGFLSAIAIASSNYVINEWLDREFDAFHPVKSGRTAVHWTLSPKLVYLEYVALATIGVGSSRVDLQACKLEYSIVSPK